MKKTKHLKRITILFILLVSSFGFAQFNPNIRLNQIGFYTKGPKVAAIINCNKTAFSIKALGTSNAVFTGNLSAEKSWDQSGENVKTADFSSFVTPGTYVLTIDGFGESYQFKIANNIYTTLNKAVLKAYYYNRCSTALLAVNAGQWARSAGHPDTAVKVHPQAASASRPAGTSLASPKGWYDAGDYNSYVVNSGISTYTLMMSYEQFKPYYDSLNINIPESGNSTPDILDEIKWNLDWMLSMQDPTDGGVYSKKTEAVFSSFTMPDKVLSERYVVGKTTAATADFAAVMAVAYRIYKNSNLTFANSCLAASKKAFQWTNSNPNVIFQIANAQAGFPAVTTGDYGDSIVSDELEWAATELYIATKDDNYYSKSFKNTNNYSVPSWQQVRILGLLSLLYHHDSLTKIGKNDYENMKAKLKSVVDKLLTYQQSNSPYKIVMGEGNASNFSWGSNANAANQAVVLLNAYRVFNTENYAIAALSNVDYLLGRNAVGYSFITGFGSKKVMNIHHRISFSDNIVEPVPGWLAGGPTTQTGNDGCAIDVPHPAKSYTDDKNCFSKNEVAINWNAPALYITSALSAFNAVATTPQDPVGPVGYTFSVKENGTVPVTGTVDIAYGANGSYKYLLNVTANTPCNNATFLGDPAPNIVKACFVKPSSTNTGAPIGQTISMKGNNNLFVSSENGTIPMNCNRAIADLWEKFTIEDAGAGKVALKGNNGKYVSSENGVQKMNCNRSFANSASVGAFEKFDWIYVSSNKAALKGNNGKFVSIVDMICNKDTKTVTEEFIWTSTASRLDDTINNDLMDIVLYPNPTSGSITLNVPLHSSIEIMDSLGKVIVSKNNTMEESNIFDLKNQNSGVYFVKVSNNEVVNFKKLILN
jgi:endoglucanase